jgi:hypothetical protein
MSRPQLQRSQLADRGQHRAPSVPDLLLAATGELANLTVLHVGKYFDLIAAITGKPVERRSTTCWTPGWRPDVRRRP